MNNPLLVEHRIQQQPSTVLVQVQYCSELARICLASKLAKEDFGSSERCGSDGAHGANHPVMPLEPDQQRF